MKQASTSIIANELSTSYYYVYINDKEVEVPLAGIVLNEDLYLGCSVYLETREWWYQKRKYRDYPDNQKYYFDCVGCRKEMIDDVLYIYLWVEDVRSEVKVNDELTCEDYFEPIERLLIPEKYPKENMYFFRDGKKVSL